MGAEGANGFLVRLAYLIEDRWRNDRHAGIEQNTVLDRRQEIVDLAATPSRAIVGNTSANCYANHRPLALQEDGKDDLVQGGPTKAKSEKTGSWTFTATRLSNDAGWRLIAKHERDAVSHITLVEPVPR